jgi:hypothetical protein
MSYPPKNYKEWLRTMKRLGWIDNRVGKGKHAYKFSHPTRKTKDWRIQRNFIIIPHKIYPVISKRIVQQLTFFNYTLEEIKEACK